MPMPRWEEPDNERRARTATDNPEPKPDLERQTTIIGTSAAAAGGSAYLANRAVIYFGLTGTALAAAPMYVGVAAVLIVSKEMYTRSQHVSQAMLQLRLIRALWRAYQGYAREWTDEHGRHPEDMPNELAMPFPASLYTYEVIQQKMGKARLVDDRLRSADCDVDTEVSPILQGMLIELQNAAGFFTRSDRIGYNTSCALKSFEAGVTQNRLYWKQARIRDAVLMWYRQRMVNLVPLAPATYQR